MYTKFFVVLLCAVACTAQDDTDWAAKANLPANTIVPQGVDFSADGCKEAEYTTCLVNPHGWSAEEIADRTKKAADEAAKAAADCLKNLEGCLKDGIDEAAKAPNPECDTLDLIGWCAKKAGCSLSNWTTYCDARRGKLTGNKCNNNACDGGHLNGAVALKSSFLATMLVALVAFLMH
mmetsp:Transcript_94219/g.130859  ORF Transcript_94219/g.130859 Transcript_94219/m.130859 type:complete len:178 (+) Transcript_94219:27-560(+)